MELLEKYLERFDDCYQIKMGTQVFSGEIGIRTHVSSVIYLFNDILNFLNPIQSQCLSIRNRTNILYSQIET